MAVTPPKASTPSAKSDPKFEARFGTPNGASPVVRFDSTILVQRDGVTVMTDKPEPGDIPLHEVQTRPDGTYQ